MKIMTDRYTNLFAAWLLQHKIAKCFIHHLTLPFDIHTYYAEKCPNDN